MSVSRSGYGGRVLVVEGNPIDRARLETILTEAGYAVDTAIDAIHAGELALLRDYELVLTSASAASLGDRLAEITTVERVAEMDIVAAVAERLGLPEKHDPPLIEPDRLERLRADTTPDLFSKLLAHYLEGGRERLARIASLLARGDLTTLAREAHALKGLSATFGAPRLRAHARAIEKAAKAKNLRTARAALPDLQAVAEQTWASFEHQLFQSETKHDR
ncbi:MAG TPA: Hpt domain-containing protein [Alphaproteobacteria bacterium]|nr:Hpt domain-containing protein [Alphaproteobacteria bacterium]